MPNAVEFDPQIAPINAPEVVEELNPEIARKAQEINAMAEILVLGFQGCGKLQRNVYDTTGKIHKINASIRDLTALQKLFPREPTGDVVITGEMRVLAKRLAASGIDLFDADAETVSADWVKKFQGTLASQECDSLKIDMQGLMRYTEDYLGKLSNIQKTLSNMLHTWDRFLQKMLDNGVRR